MDIGTSIPLPAYTLDPAFIAKKAEELGFESIWYAEHPAVPVHSDSPFPATGGAIPENYSHFTDPYIALARASGVTSNIKLCTGITLVPERNPLLLAKEIAVLDRVSGGRFVFGIGTGWLREETELMGGDFYHRWTQTREAIEVMKELWTKDEAEYHGRFFDFPPVKSYPKPTQNPIRQCFWAEWPRTCCAEWWPTPTAGCPTGFLPPRSRKAGPSWMPWPRRPAGTRRHLR